MRRLTGYVAACLLLLLILALGDRACVGSRELGATSKASECRGSLRSLLAQVAALDAGVPLDFDAVHVEGGRYGYLLGSDGPRSPPSGAGPLPVAHAVYQQPSQRSGPQRTWEPKLPLPSGVGPGRTDAGVVLVCAGDLDGDEGFDVWSIADFERQVPDEKVGAGVPLHEVRDRPGYRNPLARWLGAPAPVEEVALTTD